MALCYNRRIFISLNKVRFFMKKQRGFTLVELLVVIAIIGLLSTLAVVALGSARSKARDARRVSDIKQIQTGLELYFADQGLYPVEATAVTLGDANHDVLSENGFEASATLPANTEVYMGQVPATISQPATIADYEYTSTDGTTYDITFELEGTVGDLSGTITATPSGMIAS